VHQTRKKSLYGDTNLKYKLLCFLTPNKKIIEKGTSFYPV